MSGVDTRRMQMVSHYCEECIELSRHDCTGKSAAIKNDIVRVFAPDGSFELKPDYIEHNSHNLQGGNTRVHGLNFCSQYKLNHAKLQPLKSQQTVREEFAGRRATSKVEAAIRKAADKERKQNLRKARVLKQRISAVQQAAQQAVRQTTQQTAQNEPEILVTPVIKRPVVETPVVETPVVETPVVETPVVETKQNTQADVQLSSDDFNDLLI